MLFVFICFYLFNMLIKMHHMITDQVWSDLDLYDTDFNPYSTNHVIAIFSLSNFTHSNLWGEWVDIWIL